MTIRTLLPEAQELQPDVVRLRRTIHRHPELGLQLPRTQAAVLQALDGLGLRIRKGESADVRAGDARGRPARPFCCALTWMPSRSTRKPASTSLPRWQE